MADKNAIIAGILIILFVLAVVYTVIEDPFHIIRPPRRPRTPPPRRDPAKPLQLLERHPSEGLAWSKAAYPDQYAESNVKTSEFRGLEDFENERFLDIGARAYSREFLEDFSYTDPDKMPKVRVEYLARSEAFAGRVVGSGLKPNFAYQIKLRGVWEDREAFENIGYTGRWRLPGRGTNYTDKDYEESEEKSEVEAYILFDYTVTDPAGNISKEFYLDSSLHVLWSFTQQREPRLTDTSPVPFIRDGGDRRLYAHPRADLSPQALFAESQQHFGKANVRAPMGQAFLPPGHYRAEVVLTEESFHGYGDCGFWATVMAADVEFEIVDKPKPPPAGWLASEVLLESVSLSDATVEDMTVAERTDTALEGEADGGWATITFPDSVSLPAGKRLLLAAELYCEGEQTWFLFVSDEPVDYDLRATRRIPSDGPKGWQSFEVEITGAAAGRDCFFGIVPADRMGKVGIRNVAIRAIEESPPVE